MHRLIALGSLCWFLFALGCSSMPMTPLQKFGGKQSHRKAQKSADAEGGEEADDGKTAIEKRLIVQNEDEADIEEPADDDVFSPQSKHRTRIKESDGLSKLMQDFIDPRTVDINRNLGYE